MSKLETIPIRVEFGRPKVANIEIGHQVLRTIGEALSRLHEFGQTYSIDLSQLPRMTPETYQYLKDSLSGGEVSAVVQTQVKVEILETGYPGVWWVRHHDEQEEITTEFIEITEMPNILRPHRVDILEGMKRFERFQQEWNKEPGSASAPGLVTAEQAAEPRDNE